MAPLKSKSVSAKPAPPWYNHDIYVARAKRCKLEKIWRCSRAPDDLSRLKEQAKEQKRLLQKGKEEYYEENISSCDGDQERLYGLLNTLLVRKKVKKLP